MLPNVKLIPANVTDVARIVTMYHQSFKPLYDRYHDQQTNPYCETAASITAKLKRPESHYQLIFEQRHLVGLIRIVTETDQTARISPLLILPAEQGHHLAEAALMTAERDYPTIHTWQVDTIAQEAKLRHLYQRMGYQQLVGRRTSLQPGMDLIYFEKRV